MSPLHRRGLCWPPGGSSPLTPPRGQSRRMVVACVQAGNGLSVAGVGDRWPWGCGETAVLGRESRASKFHLETGVLRVWAILLKCHCCY